MLERLLPSLSPGNRLLLLNISLALAYYVTAQLGMALAIGPLRITAIWPPAGIALAALMLCGLRVFPGLMLGSVATHFSDFFGPQLGYGGSALLGAALLASGSLVQATLAAHLVRDVPGKVEAAPVRQTLHFALVVGACSLIGASVGEATLYAFGKAAPKEIFFGGLTWWVGDVAGMLLVAPPALLLLHPAFRGQRVAAQAFPIICMGLGLTLFATLSVGVMERDLHIERFRSDGTRLAMALQNHIDMAERDLEILQRMFYKVELQPDEFRTVSGPMLERSPWQQHFAYLPRVSLIDRDSFEERNGDLTLREVSPRDTVISAGLRPEYFPVQWTAPEAGREALLGIDHLADPQRGAAIDKARESGGIASSLPLHSVAQTATSDLVQVLYAPLPGLTSRGLLMDPQNLRGMVAATIDVGLLLRAAVTQMDINGHHLLLYDPDAPTAHALEWPANETLVIRDQAERDRALPQLNSGIHHEVALQVADRRWMLLLQPAWAQLVPKPGWLQLAVLASGLIFTTLLTGFMVARRRHDLLVRDQQQALESQVVERTRELARSNESLRDEVAERERAEQQLQMFRWLAESAHQGLGISELDGRMVYLNPALRQMTGDVDWTPASNRNLLDYMGRRFRKIFVDEVMPALKEHEHWEGEWRIAARGGRPARVLAQSHFILKDDLGHPLYMASLITDVTQQRAVEDELRDAQQRAEAANRAKSMFLANMSHEIRTPLNAVLGFTQILLADRTLPAAAHQRLEVILSAGNRLLGLINDVLDLAKIESGKLNLVLQAFDLQRELQDISHLFASRVAAKGLAWEADLSGLPVPSMVQSDRNKIGQVVINLLGNALKFTERGRIRLQAWRDGASLWIEVEDTGPGMEAAELEQLFTPFSQGEAGRDKGGSGLGLVLSRDIARALGGELTLTSTPGVGTRARVVLPLPAVDAPEGIALADVQLARLDPATPCRALVVEDDRDSRDLLVKLLLDIGCEVQQADDGQAGLEACRHERFDIVFSDIRMPRMTGVDLIRALRAAPETAALPVVAVTASSLEHERRFYIEIGFQDFVPKPYPFRDIYRMLARYAGVRFIDEPGPPAAPTSGPAHGPVASAPAETPQASLDAETRQRLVELQAAAADGDLGRVKQLLAGLPPDSLGSARGRAWEDAAKRYDFQGLEEAVGEFLRHAPGA
ncbi:MAG TPA: ATP-binding protein [Ideonella sp.]|uniref:ATP-binding protein n=1 Tax=Ideonella sp. TaxID=1929293 RepID=UPI002E340DAE|nr:ATP-binding protein [Ideonella sp.]HEX5684178.1 ATP-binding protein [Ideonella sp.]